MHGDSLAEHPPPLAIGDFVGLLLEQRGEAPAGVEWLELRGEEGPVHLCVADGQNMGRVVPAIHPSAERWHTARRLLPVHLNNMAVAFVLSYSSEWITKTRST